MMISIANIKYSKMNHFNNFTLEFLYSRFHRISQLFHNKLSCEHIINQIKAQNKGANENFVLSLHFLLLNYTTQVTKIKLPIKNILKDV